LHSTGVEYAWDHGLWYQMKRKMNSGAILGY
jgi:hypothetical protein